MSQALTATDRVIWLRGRHANKAEQELARFWSTVDKTPTCWLWTATIHPHGHGKFTSFGKTQRAHRFAYQTLVGPVPNGLDLHHRCEVKRCVNPAHLEPLPRRDHRIQHAGDHCKHGHPYDEENTYWRSTYRVCRACRREYEKSYHQRKRAKT